MKFSPLSRAPFQLLPVPAEYWWYVSMEFGFGFSEHDHEKNGILVFVDPFIQIVHLAAKSESITAQGCIHVLIDTIFRLTG